MEGHDSKYWKSNIRSDTYSPARVQYYFYSYRFKESFDFIKPTYTSLPSVTNFKQIEKALVHWAYYISWRVKIQDEQIAKTINDQGCIPLTCFCQITGWFLYTSLDQFKDPFLCMMSITGRTNSKTGYIKKNPASCLISIFVLGPCTTVVTAAGISATWQGLQRRSG